MSASETLEPAVLNFPIQLEKEKRTKLPLYQYAQQIRLEALSYLKDLQQGKYPLGRKGILWLRSVNEALVKLGYPPVTNYQFLGVKPVAAADTHQKAEVIELGVADQKCFNFPVDNEERFDLLQVHENGFLLRERIIRLLTNIKAYNFPVDVEIINIVMNHNSELEKLGFTPIEVPELQNPTKTIMP